MSITVPRSRQPVTFAVLLLATSTFSLLQSLVTPALATIQADLHTTQTVATWVITGYLLSAAIATPIMGRLGDILGKRRVFIAALIALTAGGLIAALAPSIEILITARLIQGIGGGVVPLAFGIVRDQFPTHRVGGAVGAIASLSAVGAGLGIVLAGPIVEALGYHWLFWIPMILTAVSALVALRFVPESPVRTPGRISIVPAALLSGFLVCLLLALSQSSSWGWGSAGVIGLLAAAGLLAIGWVFSETRVASPLIDMRMMRQRTVWVINLASFCLGLGQYALFAFLPQWLQTPTKAGYGMGASVTESGLMILPLTVAMFVIGVFIGRLAKHLGLKTLSIGGSAIGAVAMILIVFVNDEPWMIYAWMALIGIGFGAAFSAMSGLIVTAVPPEQTGVASGMNVNIRTIGGSVGTALMASIVTSHITANGFPAAGSYTTGFLVLTGAVLLATLAGFLIPATRPNQPEREREESPGRTLADSESLYGADDN